MVTTMIPPLVYSMAPAEVVDPLIYDGLVEELIEVLEVKNPLLQVNSSPFSLLLSSVFSKK